jgi:hypothetical protein
MAAVCLEDRVERQGQLGDVTVIDPAVAELAREILQ